MIFKLTSLVTLALALSASDAVEAGPVKRLDNSQLSVLFTPRCRPAISTATSGYDVISDCVDLSKVKTIVSFGDSYTDCGQRDGKGCPEPSLPNGATTPPATGSSSDYNYRKRASNGRTWVEDLAKNLNVNLRNFAVGGATVDRNIIPASRVDNDLQAQYVTFRAGAFKLDPKSTLCTFWFGINDNEKVANVSPDKDTQQKLLVQAAQKELSYAAMLKDTCDQLVFIDIRGNSFGNALQTGVTSLSEAGTKAAVVSVRDLFSDFVTNARSYGFKRTDPCLVNTSDSTHWKLVCTPDETINSLYYIGHHPTGKAHEDIAEFIQAGLQSCANSGAAQCSA